MQGDPQQRSLVAAFHYQRPLTVFFCLGDERHQVAALPLVGRVPAFPAADGEEKDRSCSFFLVANVPRARRMPPQTAVQQKGATRATQRLSSYQVRPRERPARMVLLE